MLTNEWVMGTGDLSVPLALREAVFLNEQHAEGPEEDAYDGQAMHLVLYDEGRPVATGRIYHDGRSFRIGRCCVAAGSRGEGIGDLLIKLLLLKTFEFAPQQVRIHAQEQAVPFYERYGFAAEGEPFTEAGIRHVAMHVDKDTLKMPSKCGKVRGFDDFFEVRTQTDGSGQE